ncbi:MAG: GNAT family N-acetyltransferase [Candidatus Methanomethylophilaceae archaeon]
MTVLEKKNGITYRNVDENDVPMIFQKIKDLAEYEGKTKEVISTEEDIHYILFVKKIGYAVVAEGEAGLVGLLLYYDIFSTFKGKAGIYIEDLIVDRNHRHMGIGKTLLELAFRIAGNGYVEWMCLRHNVSAQEFYKKMGSEYIDEWVLFRKDL